MKHEGFTPAFMTKLKTGDVFEIGHLLPGVSKEGVWWQVLTARQEPPAIECRIFYRDIPMGNVHVKLNKAGDVEVRKV